MNINAFVDNGFPEGKEFCFQFLHSKEFTTDTLSNIKRSRSRKKIDVASNISEALEKGTISPNRILLEYARQPRTWLSFKLGKTTLTYQAKDPQILLQKFGEDGWYGPIKDLENNKNYYIRIRKVVDYINRGSGEASQLDERGIRWSTIAEVSTKYVALSWNGFTFSPMREDSIDRQIQFPFWMYIPQYFEELTNRCQANWIEPKLHQLILFDMWDKYLNKNPDRWQHLRIRAESSGVALNAHSSEVKEINVKGLKALSGKIAESTLAVLEQPLEKKDLVENAVLQTLIKEWGTKSYEFSLELNHLNQNNNSNKNNKFRAHCYFGLKPGSRNQDSLQHLKCYKVCGGSTEALKFLIRELGI